jgi:hypothetical protein
VGGLIFSQMRTLFTTPVVYLYLDRYRLRWEGMRRRFLPFDYDTGAAGFLRAGEAGRR